MTMSFLDYRVKIWVFKRRIAIKVFRVIYRGWKRLRFLELYIEDGSFSGCVFPERDLFQDPSNHVKRRGWSFSSLAVLWKYIVNLRLDYNRPNSSWDDLAVSSAKSSDDPVKQNRPD